MTDPNQSAAGVSQATVWRQRWGLQSAATLRVRVGELGGSIYLVDGLLPARSISLVLGDSGLGKSPLMYQLAICVAAGLPFLGRSTLQARVLMADFENGIGEVIEMIETISGYLGLSGPPGEDQLLVWPASDCSPRYGQSGHTLLDMLGDVRPHLAIIDSLGSYDPTAEGKNPPANLLLKDFRRLAQEHNTATVFVHHRRKLARKSDEQAGPLESAELRRWFQDSRGASALITGSDVRLGVDLPGDQVDLAEALALARTPGTAREETALVLRGFGRVRGEIGPWRLARAYDEDGDPLGYRSLCSAELLFNPEQQRALAQLGDRFTTGEARAAYRREDQATSDWLNKCARLGLVRKTGWGRWEKLRDSGGSGER